MSSAGIWRLLVAGGLIHLVLIVPATPLPLPQIFARVAPELPLLLLALGCLGQSARILIVLGMLMLTLQKLADLAMLDAMGRSFNPLVDLPLIVAGMRLLAGSIGTVGLVALVVISLAAFAFTAALLWWSTGIWSRLRLGGALRSGLVLAAAVAMVAAIMGTTWQGNGPYAKARLQLAFDTAQESHQFSALAATDPFADRQDLLTAIDRDVLIIFVESYGRTSFDTPFYAETHIPTLRAAERDLTDAGLTIRSGFLKAPTQGGQSWLSHGTFANGLWLNDQIRYRAALASGRQSLFHHARASGFRTAAVMPAITLPWPEAATMGFDTVLAAKDLGYHGLPFNWVTMPDQFTLASVDRLLGQSSDRRPLFVQIALISSHAPWVPVPHLVPWDQVGDGTVFNEMASAGDPPEVVWRDRDRVRDSYRASIDYSLHVVMEYALRHAENPPLMIVLGDHQAAPSIALDQRPDVAVHLIGPAYLVDRGADWGFAPGLVPPAGSEALPMDRMRDLILGSFSDRGPET